MSEKIVFVRTSSGEDEVRSRTAHLSKDIKRALLMVDGTATVAEIIKRASPSLRGMLGDMFIELAKGGFIQDKARAASLSKLITPNIPAASPKKPAKEEDELDFTAAYRAPTQAMLEEEAARVQMVAAAKAAAEAKSRAETEAQARLEADAEARKREEAKQRAAEALEAARKAEQHAAEVRAEVEAKARAVGEEKARLEAEVLKLKAQAEAETRSRVVAEAQARLETDAARLKTQQELERMARETAEAARKAEQRAAEIKAEAEAEARAVGEEKARLEAEVAKLKAQAEAEAKSRAMVEAQARLEADAAKAQAERLAGEAQAARIKAEQDAVKMRAEAEERVRVAAERHARAESEAVHKAEQHAAEVKAETEAKARVVAQEKAKLEAEVAKLRAQAEAEAGARAEAAEQAKRETERLAREAEAARAKAEQEAERAREEVERVRQQAAAEARAREEAERVARQAEAARVQAEQEAARIKAEAEARARAEAAEVQQRAEASRLKIEQSAANVRNAVERARQAAEARAHDEAARRATEADEALKAEQEVAQAMKRGESEARTNAEMLVSIVRLNTKHAAMEESVFSALDELAQQESAEEAAQRADILQDVSSGLAAEAASTSVAERRTTIAAVVFFDVVGYSAQPNSRQIELKKQFNQLVSNSINLLGSSERIILDTGDGVAIGFLQHPTDALEAAMHFRNGLMANKYHDYPDLRVRIGIHLGPVSLVKDMNGRINMLGDGINSAQRVMCLASKNQIYVSRAYFDFVSSLSDEYGDLFRYRGSQQDKHGREFQVYELLDAEVSAEELVQTQDSSPLEPSNDLADFDFAAFDAVLSQPSQEILKSQPAEPPSAELQQTDVAGQLLRDAIGLGQAETVKSVEEPAVSDAGDQTDAVAEEPLRAATQERQYSETEAMQLAEAQAKKWQEAEQRAAELARKNAESASTKVLQPSVEAAPSGRARSRRKPVSWGKLGAGLFMLVLAALFVVPAVLPTQVYLKRMEQLIGSKLQQPVHIGHLAGRILPTPRLVLGDVSIGEAGKIQSRQVQVNFAFSALFDSKRHIDSLDLDGVQVKGAALPLVADWLQQLAGDYQYPIARILLTQGQMEADGIKFSDVGGEFNFDPAGKFAFASLNADGHKLALDMRAMPEQKLHISLTLRDSALPLLPNWPFEELKATGELTRDEWRITDLDSRIMGGVLTGEARINWRSGWRAQGALVAKVIPLQNLSKLLSGDMDGSARFQMQAENLAGLTDAAVLNGVFAVRKGLVSGMDIVETARLRSRENLPGGRTHFDELTGELAYANESYQFRQLKMNDSVVKASGSLTIVKQQLSGSVSANLAMRAGMGAVALQVGGTTESPTLRAVR